MTQLLTEEQRTNFPVEHLSPSSIRKYLENPHGFFKNYVRLEYDDTLSPALLEGDAMHRVLAEYYDGLTKAPQHRKQFDHAAAAELEQDLPGVEVVLLGRALGVGIREMPARADLRGFLGKGRGDHR